MADDETSPAPPRNIYDNAGRQILRGRRGHDIRYAENRFKGETCRELRAYDDTQAYIKNINLGAVILHSPFFVFYFGKFEFSVVALFWVLGEFFVKADRRGFVYFN